MSEGTAYVNASDNDNVARRGGSDTRDGVCMDVNGDGVDSGEECCDVGDGGAGEIAGNESGYEGGRSEDREDREDSPLARAVIAGAQLQGAASRMMMEINTVLAF